ncbi:AAA family ATPase [Thioflexithrix psekupsensis]|uniref:AAA+ ATPase domain-containing protein n=1 Tax=Thioflexithrix psekupsensis TaxID=1570016 RepID=A0A251XBC4_9GAMM|nr:AAA family ATPase [Thioflexithrix psekupsensis]OUD15741.1 hypothetical protein TPSD3_04320 [Thioflexithrix psekupsensis]
MYQAHFGLTAAPFSITPDPQYLYLSEPHREALAHLLYGVNESPGFVLLTGEVGTGKTTLCRCLIEQLPKHVDIALLLNPRVSPLELLAAIFDELRIHYDVAFTLKDFIDTLNAYLLTAHTVGRRTVVILDEAQNLSTEVLEQVRLLTNLETTQQKLLQIVLVGQPELQKILKRDNLRQLSQRITARYHLLPLSLRDTQAYINHRLAVGGAREPLFTKGAMRRVFRESGGIPRLINIICDRALLGGYVNNRTVIDVGIVRKAVQEVMGTLPLRFWAKDGFYAGLTSLLLTVMVASGGAWWLFSPQAAAFRPEITLFPAALSPNTPTPEPLPVIIQQEEPNPPATIVEEAPPTTVVATESVVDAESSDFVPLPPDGNTPAEPDPVTTDETPAVAPAPMPLKQLIASGQVDSNTDTAFATLFGLWGESYQPRNNVTACERAAEVGLACLYKTGSWNDLRLYNRPAVIELVTGAGEQHHVVVLQLTEEQAVLDFGGKRYHFELKAINEHWLGQLLLFWQPAAMPIPKLRPGMRGDAVLWLRRRLAVLNGQNLDEVVLSNRFDNELRNQVLAFQQKHRLQIDGVVGEETQLMLDGLAGQPPVLIQR